MKPRPVMNVTHTSRVKPTVLYCKAYDKLDGVVLYFDVRLQNIDGNVSLVFQWYNTSYNTFVSHFHDAHRLLSVSAVPVIPLESFAASTRNTDQPSCPVVSYKSEVNRFAQEKGDYTPISKFALAQKQSKKYSTQSDTQLLSMPDAPQCQQFRYSTGDCTKKSAASRRVPLLGLSNAGAGSWLSGWQTSGETYPSYGKV